MCNNESFKISDNAIRWYELALKEGKDIRWCIPSLTYTKKHEILELFV